MARKKLPQRILSNPANSTRHQQFQSPLYRIFILSAPPTIQRLMLHFVPTIEMELENVADISLSGRHLALLHLNVGPVSICQLFFSSQRCGIQCDSPESTD